MPKTQEQFLAMYRTYGMPKTQALFFGDVIFAQWSNLLTQRFGNDDRLLMIDQEFLNEQTT